MVPIYEAGFPVEKLREYPVGRPLRSITDSEVVLREAADNDSEVGDFVLSGRFDEVDMSWYAFSRVVFSNCSFRNCTFGNSSFSGCLFIDSDISNCSFEKSWFRESCLYATRGVGVNCFEARLARTRIAGCKLQYANFSKTRLQKVVVEKSDCSEVSFVESRFKDMTFRETDFTRADFLRTALSGIDFTSCEIAGLALSDNIAELKGAVISAAQAINLTRTFGVVVQ